MKKHYIYSVKFYFSPLFFSLPKHKNFKIYRSSAGSGKTYVLSLNYIAISLKGSVQYQTDYYKKILAITFTNKAASEMKMRVLYYLDVLSKEKNEDEILQWLQKETKLNEKIIFSNAKKVRDHILHHYSDLSISTIDKFTYRIVRSFAKDLGLSQNFELEMDNSKIIQPVVALLIGQISNQGDHLSNALVNFALEKAEDGKSYNIEADLEKFAQQLFKEQAADYIDNKTLSLEESRKVKDKLRKRIRFFQKEIKKKSEEVLNFLHVKGISPEYFSRKNFYNYFAKNLLTFDSQKMKPNTSLIKQITDKQLYTNEIKNNSKFSKIKDLIDRNFEELSSFYFDIQEYLDQHLINYTSYLAIEKNIYSIMILQQLIKETKDYKNRENIEQISDFNKKIHGVITKQFAAFIYERIGNRYNHYLLDEFQDTSTLQWQNLLPLITDSIDYGKSLIVGDGKQSIYRWRGGEVEQFLKLPSIYKGDKLDLKKEWEDKLRIHENLENLEDNFRSKKKIIEFNNLFFSRMKSLLTEDLKGIYDLHSQEIKEAPEGGYVHLELIEEGEKGFKQEVCNRVIQEIKKLTSKNKYTYKDITILCNSRKRVSLIAESLTNAAIDVVSNEGLLLSKSEHVNVLLAIFEYLQDQDDAVAKTTILHYLSRNSYTGNKSNEPALEIEDTNHFLSILKTFNITFSITRLLKLPIFQLLERSKKIFKIPEDLYVQFFSDVVLKYEQENRGCLSDFLVWWEEAKEREAIVMPEKTNAVQVMTIHKSKGLAFNVVMIPFNWEDRKNSQEIWVDTSDLLEESLPAALINTNQTLSLSHFAKKYQEEKNLNLLDNLNKLYVATTRPRERLYIFAKEYPKSISETFKSKGNLNSFLYAFQEDYPYVQGNPKESHITKSKSKDNIFTDANFEKANWKEVIALKHTVDKYWDTENHLNKVDWGKLLHLALADIHHLDDKNDVLNRLFASGQCNKQDKERLDNAISSLFNHAKIKQYFTGEWEVKTEREILLSTGDTYIPDRLLFKGKEVIILDYKTGIRRKSHKNQIDNYASILEEMGYAVKEKKLIYTKEYLER